MTFASCRMMCGYVVPWLKATAGAQLNGFRQRAGGGEACVCVCVCESILRDSVQCVFGAGAEVCLIFTLHSVCVCVCVTLYVCRYVCVVFVCAQTSSFIKTVTLTS